ncbi:MAG: fumarylacetoacetate hydrolase family protein [Chloroflexi bacterium]|nr:fumarylacetoacetate hydrolase family protein [Chloroflexota bacterium]
MKLVLYQQAPGGPDATLHPGLLTPDGVVNIDGATRGFDRTTPSNLMKAIIDNYERIKPDLERLAGGGPHIPMNAVRLRAPMPRPGKMLNCIGNYWEHQQRDARPLNMFLKNPDAVIGPGDTIVLPKFTEPYVFQHEAELGIVLKGPSKEVPRGDYLKAIFGYTCVIDVSARAEGRSTWRNGSWMGKSFDTFGPLGPCIVTADEIPDPNSLEVRFWDNGELRHEYNTSDMEHRVPELIEWASTIMTLNSGDVISCGTNHEGLGPLQDGDQVDLEVKGIGKLTVNVSDPLKRTWERGVYMGVNSTNPAAVAARLAAGLPAQEPPRRRGGGEG